MLGRFKDSLDLMAIVTDKEKRSTEALDVNYVYVVEEKKNYLNKIAVFVLAFGGMDSTGKLHVDQSRVNNGAQVIIKSPLFEQLFETPEGNPKYENTQDELNQLFTEHLLPNADKYAWSFDEYTIEVPGQATLQKTKAENDIKSDIIEKTR